MVPFTITELAQAFVTVCSKPFGLFITGLIAYTGYIISSAWEHSTEMKERAIDEKIPITLKTIHIHFPKRKK